MLTLPNAQPEQAMSAKKKPVEVNRDKTHERLAAVIATFTTLRDDGQVLIERIHQSLLEMRELRHQLRELRGRRPSGSNGNAGARTAYLQTKFGFTARETEVALLLGQGKSNVSIAKTLGISTHTARHHTQRVLGKLKVHSRAEAGAKLRS
jgi:DNA-binding NarL/FixJ family response regulator